MYIFYCKVKSNYSSNFTQSNSECICSKSEHGHSLNSSSSLTFLLSQQSLLLIRTFILKNIKKVLRHSKIHTFHTSTLLWMLFLLQKRHYLLTLFGADGFDAKEKPSKILPIYLTSVSDPTKIITELGNI